MKKSAFIILISLIFSLIVFLFILISLSMAKEDKNQEEEFGYKTIIKTVDGLKFKVAEDRPVEKKHGIVAPMELDKYVALKFSKLEERLQNIEDAIRKIEEKLSLIKDEPSDDTHIQKRRYSRKISQ